jgi:lipopolysaccharide export system protein LptA
MASLKRIWMASLACGSLLVCGHALAQIAPGTGKGPISTVQDKLEQDNTKNIVISTGSVEADQAGARLVTDKLTIYKYAPGEGPNAQAKPSAPSVKGPAAPGDDQLTTGNIKQMIAEGHVFYVTQNETARADRMVYDAPPDTITLTGGVIVVQGKNVLRGDKMVIDRKTGLTTAASDATGRNNPNRVRAVIYNDNQDDQGKAAPSPQAQGQPAAKPAPAKKP